MNKKVLLMDVDGVICNFIDGLINSHGWPFSHAEFDCWDYHRGHEISDEEMWSVTNDGKWWLGLEPYPYASRFVEEAMDLWDVVFCTSPSKDATCASQKVQWLRNHGFMEEDGMNFQIGKRKELNAGSGAILLDDSDSNVRKFRLAGGSAVLFPQPWNENRRYAHDQLNFVWDQLARFID